MSNEFIGENELTKERTPSELWDWVGQKTGQIYYSCDGGRRALRLQKGLTKPLVEEVLPLAIFGKHKFGDTDQVLLQPVIGNQPSYDAVVTDMRTEPPTRSLVEITQSHEGRDNYLRRCELLDKGRVPPYAPVVKTGRGRAFSIPAKASPVEQRVQNELDRIVAAAKRKEGKDHPANTSLVIFFDDAPPFQECMDHENLDAFVTGRILNLDLRFSTLHLVGRDVFREYTLVKKA